ncbi:unnamed protein product [Albugo candida]|uniref:Uncharacterized protein n=1 Tax=Albugo candida TaxID=65357 RepID=A0A024FU19_9STRA|nr:unnamed protein product [Albugo candida]|eukprot:CCI10164.1 unnamed protein product [Albugo candida]
MVQVKVVSLSGRRSITRDWSVKDEYRATTPRQIRSAFCVSVKSLAALSTHYGEKSQTPVVINNTTLPLRILCWSLHEKACSDSVNVQDTRMSMVCHPSFAGRLLNQYLRNIISWTRDIGICATSIASVRTRLRWLESDYRLQQKNFVVRSRPQTCSRLHHRLGRQSV